ncbi:hypothetical protein SAMN05421548_14435 [Paraburkholderia lycopersici]|uniref:Uncharacterized protein n=1 Tax=Paraburkholderia lycopersici TaxID=416944 RepID=A0A1G7CF01_9BURK|nr:hypothetical protein SAMN05421548_14435 [Paraburkholderia lycopersici]
MVNPHPEPGSLEREFESALEVLEARFAARERAIRCHSAESPAVREAQSAYHLARLVLLSCELRLRSRGVTHPSAHRRSISTLIYSPSEAFRNSLTLLLRAYGYHTASVGTLPALRCAIQDQPCAAIVSCFERRICCEPLFIEGVVWAAQLIPIFMLHSDAGPSTRFTLEHPRIRSVASIESLVDQLDKVIDVGHGAAGSVSQTGGQMQALPMARRGKPGDALDVDESPPHRPPTRGRPPFAADLIAREETRPIPAVNGTRRQTPG